MPHSSLAFVGAALTVLAAVAAARWAVRGRGEDRRVGWIVAAGLLLTAGWFVAAATGHQP